MMSLSTSLRTANAAPVAPSRALKRRSSSKALIEASTDSPLRARKKPMSASRAERGLLRPAVLAFCRSTARAYSASYHLAIKRCPSRSKARSASKRTILATRRRQSALNDKLCSSRGTMPKYTLSWNRSFPRVCSTMNAKLGWASSTKGNSLHTSDVTSTDSFS